MACGAFRWGVCYAVGWIILCRLSGVRAQLGCALLNYCNGHGICTTTTSTCNCYEGWGASTDVTLYKSPDCSSRVCPSGKAWSDVPTASDTAHALAECSNMGICNRDTGLCKCFSGFEGDSCQRSTCPNDCSGHGRCFNMKTLAALTEALPLSDATTYTGYSDSTTWDEEKIYGCVCDSSWDVGLASTETQQAEWFGPDCSLRHCPTGDDPETTDDETDCEGVTTSAAYSTAVGASGNLCHVDCSNRGLCDYSTGLCSCFVGYYGYNCYSSSVLAKGGSAT